MNLFGQDMKHIRRAMELLKPGGRLVALCAYGPRQQADLIPAIESAGGSYEVLEPGTFKDAGTCVNCALVWMTAPEPEPEPEAVVQTSTFVQMSLFDGSEDELEARRRWN